MQRCIELTRTNRPFGLTIIFTLGGPITTSLIQFEKAPLLLFEKRVFR